ncbi:inner membrane transport protein yfav [Ophiostoma piceae UAMH 11346]|uniref:Inner membrane transport protein yfav n=1 Tax=Ophiostoma piceae (strain UAMH 11346) TaxID=1262450 RepID=S3CRI0_OPHP1|nr:inner membrane transport protein yfav [Ophiostoma piceae UAMH 11346]
MKAGEHIYMGFPIRAINYKGEGIMYKEKNRGDQGEVKVSGVKGLPPPPPTKVGITGFTGWQAGEDQIRAELGDELLEFLTVLKFMQNGSSVIDARNQNVATVDLRIFA